MALISDEHQEIIRKHFDESMTGDVEIIMFTERESPIIIPGHQPCETCEDTRVLLEEVSALSDKIKLSVHDLAEAADHASQLGVDRVPAFVCKGAAKGQVRFFGIPSGYEFSALISDLVDVSTGATSLSDETRDFLGTLNREVNIKVFTTPS